MQEVFVTMVQTFRTFRPGPPIESWLFGIAKKERKQALRNRTRRQDIANAFFQGHLAAAPCRCPHPAR